MSKLRLISIISVLALVLALYLSKREGKWHEVLVHIDKVPVVGEILRDWSVEYFHPKGKEPAATSPTSSSQDTRLFTPEELSEYAGKKGLYLAILGKVYDVGKGERHYAEGKAYHGFAGRDGSRAFVTGQFTDEGLIDDVLDLSPQQLLSLEKWSETYDKDYIYKGKVIGRFYDAEGQPTIYHQELQKALEKGREQQKNQEDSKKIYPPCDSHYQRGKGGKVYCSTSSGGVRRDWVGHPRQLFSPETGSVRCACVHQSRLNQPNLSLYPDCDPRATECITSTT